MNFLPKAEKDKIGDKKYTIFGKPAPALVPYALNQI
jgi:hypothetical protein